MSVLMTRRTRGALPVRTDGEALPAAKVTALADFLGRCRGQESMVIPALQHAQALLGYVPRTAMAMVADALGLSLARVSGVATFYAQFRLTPAGRHTVRVCTGTACHVRGAEALLRAWLEALKVSPGGTTADGAVTLEQVACLGACGLAPAAMVDNATHGRLTAGKVKQAVARLKEA